ncbi:hypothetical protein MIND_01046600 [Mycena indigotica]|uniref:Uncharacterized protein n=1 Tax=Mycena indigotica TaxID=2126181 RepID=A0A8H6VYN3_9AGAR|nr:uncharacterized protein MIND_01046600 [Mycena indigotica]KAF7295083.1 hypothetical protein MIND_01046600 [Mycena indigotica]
MLSLGLALLLAPLALASHGSSVNHHELAKRAAVDVAERSSEHTVNITKREVFSDARWTFYSTGLGACGDWNNDGDFIVALNQGTFGYSYPSPFCNKKIVMKYGGKQTTATIKDSCPGCPYKGLDLSPGLFSFFANQDMGVIQGTWWFADGGDNGNPPPPPPPPPPPKTTKQKTTTPPPPPPPKTTTKQEDPATRTTSKTTTTTKASSSSARASSAVSSTHSAPSNSVAAPSGTVAPVSSTNPENLFSFAQAAIHLSGVVLAGAGAA